MRALLALLLACLVSTASLANSPPPPPAKAITKPGYRMGCFGDSRCANGYYFQATGSGNPYPLAENLARGVGQWASWFSHGRIILDLGTGYYAPYGGGSAVKATVLAQGSNYTSPTVSLAGCTATFTPTVVGGKIISIAVSGQASTCTPAAALTISDSTGSGASAFVTASDGGSLGGPGENTTQILARLPDACADTNDIELVWAGTNDLTTGVPLATTKANLAAIYTGLINCHKFVAIMTQAPRAQSAITATQQLQLYAIDRWIRQWVREYLAVNPDRYNAVVLVDPSSAWTDPNSATGAPLSGCMFDAQTHPAAGCAASAGWLLYNELASRLGLSGYTGSVAQNDLYDGTSNVEGPLATNPYQTGTGGTVSAPITGTLATGYTISRSGSATTTATLSQVTDPTLGRQQQLVVSAGSGTNTEHYTVYSTAYSPASLGVSVGDVLQARVTLVLSGTTKLNGVYMDLKCRDSGNNTVAYAFAGGVQASTDPYTDGWFTTAMPFTLETPLSYPAGANPAAFVIPASCASIVVDLSFGIDASGGAGSAGFTAKWSNWAIRKISP